MSGNVWEWCLNTYYDPFDFDTDTRRQRVLRGGAWFSPRDQATTQRRYKTDAEDWFYFIGFRLCMADDLSNIDIIKGTR
jgi:formylglycine-generating enzyme required for sulfatase activity